MHTGHNHIDNSNLKNLQTEGGFTVPPRYFETMHRQILEQISLLENEKHYPVPRGYFDYSRAGILAKTTRKKSVLQFVFNRSFAKYTAAAIFLIASTLLFLLSAPKQQPVVQNMTDDDIIQYLEEDGTRELSVSEVSFAIGNTQPITTDDHYLINTIDEQLIIEEL